MALCKILRGRSPVQGLVRSDTVVYPFPLLEGLAYGLYLKVTVIDLVELLGIVHTIKLSPSDSQ